MTESILLSFVPKTFIYLQRNFWELFVKLNRTTLYLFIIMIQLGLLPFQMICIFQSLSRHHLKVCKYFMWTMTNNKFWFSLSNLSFFNKIRAVKRTICVPWNRLTNDKNYLWQNLKTRVSAIIKELTQSVYCKCTITWVYLYMDA